MENFWLQSPNNKILTKPDPRHPLYRYEQVAFQHWGDKQLGNRENVNKGNTDQIAFDL